MAEITTGSGPPVGNPGNSLQMGDPRYEKRKLIRSRFASIEVAQRTFYMVANLYVAAAAIIPTPLGVNPSRTIGAVAERIAKIIGEDGR
ncbi:MAG TPA: GMC oxidoreductase [Blastocatellia bacterium]|nr:GMC oxidoreductase [Blastocatellia bacterium]